MKRKSFMILMGAVFAALMALVLFVDGLPTVFSSVMAFPFEQVGAALRALALTGNIGNGFALALCIALSCIPILSVLRHRGKKEYLGENIVLCCMIIAVFITLFSMANPSKLLSAFPYFTVEALPIVKGVMGCTVWSFIILWLILRLVRLFRGGDTNKLLCYLRVALHALCILFVAVIAISCGSTLLDGLSVTQKRMDNVMAVIRFIASSLPYIFDIGITLSLLTLLDAYVERNEEDTVRHADSLSKRCCLALGITAASTTILNVLQLLLSRFLSNISVNVEIPVVSLAFILLILILSRLIVENRKLQSDNDLFI